jgi:hypothetical protein
MQRWVQQLGRGEREVRSKLGKATRNFFSSKKDEERYG